MPVIGTFKSEKDGYIGTIRTLTVNVRVRIQSYGRKGSDGAPDFRLFAGNTEIGAAWRRTAKATNASYLRIRLDDPAFAVPIDAALMEATDDGIHHLLWRRDKREDV
jgi:uncharacterized protein (DUF736 family)